MNLKQMEPLGFIVDTEEGEAHKQIDDIHTVCVVTQLGKGAAVVSRKIDNNRLNYSDMFFFHNVKEIEQWLLNLDVATVQFNI